MTEAQVATGGTALYERDFLEWTQEQAAALRSVAAGGNARLDYENLIEEIESLGSALKHQLASRIATIIEHLLKLEFSPAVQTRPGWKATIERERGVIEDLLDESPSLRARVQSDIERVFPRAARLVARELAERNEISQPQATALQTQAVRYSRDMVLRDWFPESPGSDQSG